MHFYWVRDCLKQVHFNIFWKPVKDNLADYFKKHHPASHNKLIHPIYINLSNKHIDIRHRGCVNYDGEKSRVKVSSKPELVTKSNNLEMYVGGLKG